MGIKVTGIALSSLAQSSIRLEDLQDVSIVSPQTGQYLRYNSVISEWQNTFLNSDIYSYLSTSVSGNNGVLVTPSPGPNTISIGLDLTASGDASGIVTNGNLPLTLATVNNDIGTYGSSTAIPIVTVNAKGLVTAVSTTSFSGTAPLATSLAGGTTGAVVYQSAPDTTAFLPAGTTSQVLISGASGPSWTSSPVGLTSVGIGTTTPTATLEVSGTAKFGPTTIQGPATITAPLTAPTATFTGSVNASSLTASGSVNGAAASISGSITADAGTFFTSVTSPNFIGSFSGNASTATSLQTARTISATGDADWSVTFNGTSNVTNPITLATVNSSPQTDTFRKITVNGKGLVTATSAVTNSDITTSLGYVPVNVAGDTMTGYLILNAAPVNSLGAVTKQYVDDIASGLTIHAACVTSTDGTNLSATYSNGSSGVGATLTGTGAIPSIGGITPAVGNRVLVKDQTSQLQNGIYVVTQATANWVMTRASDFDGSPVSEIQAGDAVYVQQGTLAGTQWVQTTAGTITVGVTSIVFSQFGGPGTYTAGSGINIAGTSISNTGVLSNIAGSGISVSSATGNVTIGNTGVLSITGTANQITTSGSTGNITLSLPSSVTISGTMTAGSFSGAVSGNASTASALQTARTISATGDATWSVSFDGSTNVTNPITLVTVNSNVGSFSYPTLTVNAKGLVTAVSSNTPVTSVTAGTGIGLSASTGAVTISNNGVTSISGTANQVSVSASTGAVTVSLPSSVTISGTMTAGVFNSTSTKRVKKKIKTLGKTYLARFADLKPREYDRKDYQAHEFGFIAEEMEQVYPEVVGKDENGLASGIDYGKLSTILTAKVQEQEKTIQELKKQMQEILELVKGSK